MPKEQNISVKAKHHQKDGALLFKG